MRAITPDSLPKLIYNELKSSGKVDVTFYKNGSSNYDCYQQNAKNPGKRRPELKFQNYRKGNQPEQSAERHQDESQHSGVYGL